MPSFASVAVFAIGLSISCAAWAGKPYPHTENFGVPFSTDEAWYQQCMRVETLHAPDSSAAPNCKAGELYYTKLNQAATSQTEWNQVRACAAAHDDSAVLMMLYANGLGVQRDADMALHYACRLDYIAKSEMEARVQHLISHQPGDKPFDQCDDISSGYMGSICAENRESQDQRTREGRLERLAKPLPPASKAAFAKLRAAAESYSTASMGELDMQGTAAVAMEIQHQARLRELFMQAALDANSGKLQPSSPDLYVLLDGQLNASYQAIMTPSAKPGDTADRIGPSTTITRAAIRDAERRWLAYRDAFIAFAATLPSPPDPFAVKTLLTSQRIKQLEDIAYYR